MGGIVTLTLAWEEDGRNHIVGVSVHPDRFVHKVHEPPAEADAPEASVVSVEPVVPVEPVAAVEQGRHLLPAETQALQRTPARTSAIWLGVQRGIPTRLLHRAVNRLPADRPISLSALRRYMAWVAENPPAVLEEIDESIFVDQPNPRQAPPSSMQTPERRAKLLTMLRDGKSRGKIMQELNRDIYSGPPVRESTLGDWIRRLRQEGVAPPGSGSVVIKGRSEQSKPKALDVEVTFLSPPDQSEGEDRAEEAPQGAPDSPPESVPDLEQPPSREPSPEAPEAAPAAADRPLPFSTGHAVANGGIPRLVPRTQPPGVTVKYYSLGEARAWAAHWGMPGWTIASYEQINAYCQRHKKPYEFRDPATERAA